MRRQSAMALVISALGLLALASPATATHFRYSLAQYSFGISQGGMVLVDLQSHSLRAGLTGLQASRSYALIGRSIGCGGTPSSANRLFRLESAASASGMLSFYTNDAGSFPAAPASIWVQPIHGNAMARCAQATTYGAIHDTADFPGDAALGIWDKEHVLSVIQRRSGERVRLSLTVDAGAGNDTLEFIGSSRACGRPAGQARFSIVIDGVSIGAYVSRGFSMTKHDMDGLNSVRVRDGDGMNVGCYPMVIMANTEGD